MFKHIVLGTALMLGVGAELAPAQSPAAARWGNRHERLVNDWFQLYLRRSPTQREALVFVNQLRSGASANEVQARILSSSEYIRRSGNGVYVWANSMVADVLGRPITPAERALVADIVAKQGYYQAALTTLDSRSGWWF